MISGKRFSRCHPCRGAFLRAPRLKCLWCGKDQSRFAPRLGIKRHHECHVKHLSAVAKRQIMEMEAAGCSECGARVGEWCMTLDGYKADTHPARASAVRGLG